MKSKFKELDFYGEQIALTYKGESSYKTIPGALVTLIVLFTLLAFTLYRFMIFIQKINPDVSK